MTIKRNSAFFIILLLSLLSVSPATAQTHAKSRQAAKPLSKDQVQNIKKDANELFAAGFYDLALKGYLDIYKNDPKNADNNFRIGYCYIMTDIDKPAAVKYLKYAVEN